MANGARAVRAANRALDALTDDELNEVLANHQRVRAWLGSGVLVGVKGAGVLLGVERSRIWRYEKDEKIATVAEMDETKTKVFLRPDLEKFLREHPPQTRRRRSTTED